MGVLLASSLAPRNDSASLIGAAARRLFLFGLALVLDVALTRGRLPHKPDSKQGLTSPAALVHPLPASSFRFAPLISLRRGLRQGHGQRGLRPTPNAQPVVIMYLCCDG
jgi:hypothetical protein